MARRRTASGWEGFTPRARSLVASLGLAAAATLIVLHAFVLWDRVAHGRLAEPVVALRWLAAAVLMVALVALRRRGVSLLWGRRALVFWLLVLVLHAGAAVPPDAGPRLAAERLLFVVPAAVGPACLLALVLVAPLAGAGLGRPALFPRRAHAALVPARRGGFLPALASRPPPA